MQILHIDKQIQTNPLDFPELSALYYFQSSILIR